MARELLKIDVAQLRSGTPVAREIFLKMPRNGKMLRIAWRSDELSSELVSRLLTSPEAEIYAQPLDGDAEDAVNLPLFGDLARIKPVRDEAGALLEPMLAAIKPTRASKADDAAASPLPAAIEEIRPAVVTAQEEDSPCGRKDSFENEDFTPVEHSVAEEEGLLARRRREAAEMLVDEPTKRSETFAEETPLERRRREAAEALEGKPAIKEELGELIQFTRKRIAEVSAEETLAATIDGENTATAFSAGNDESDRLLKAESITDENQKISSSDDNEAAEEIIIPDSAIDIPIATIAGRLSRVAKGFSTTADHARENEVRLGTLLAEVTEVLFTFSQGGGEESRAELVGSLEACRAEIASQRAAGAEPSDVLQALESSLGRVAEALATENPANLAGAEFTELVEEFRSAVAKEERLAAAALGRELSSVAEVFSAFASGNTGGEEALSDLRERIASCLDDTETRIAADGAASEELITIKASLSDALKALPYTSRAAKAYRDTPQIASRLAAQLAHSLGYANPAYLGDLALSAWLFFAEKNGAAIDLPDLPPLVRIAQDCLVEPSDEQAGTPTGDLLTILAFLDRYFDNPGCDRTRKEFAPRTFESTLREFEQSTNPPDDLTTARWRYFVQKGLSMNAESLCSKASAKASKATRPQSGMPKETAV